MAAMDSSVADNFSLKKYLPNILRDYIIINPFRSFDKVNVHLLEVNKFVLIILQIENENDGIFGTSLCSSPKLVPLTSRR
jgi:hypothetical protein